MSTSAACFTAPQHRVPQERLGNLGHYSCKPSTIGPHDQPKQNFPRLLDLFEGSRAQLLGRFAPSKAFPGAWTHLKVPLEDRGWASIRVGLSMLALKRHYQE